jgi:hypothetical protein
VLEVVNTLLNLISSTVMLYVVVSAISALFRTPASQVTNILIQSGLCNYVVVYDTEAKVFDRNGNVVARGSDASKVVMQIIRDDVTICFASSEIIKHNSPIVIEGRRGVRLISFARHRLVTPFSHVYYGDNPVSFIAIVNSSDILVAGFDVDCNRSAIPKYSHTIYIADSSRVSVMFNRLANGSGKAITGWFMNVGSRELVIAFNTIVNHSQPLKFQKCFNVVVAGNVIETSDEQAVEIDNIEGLTLAFNIFKSIGRTCIEITNTPSYHTVIYGNILNDCGTTESTYPSGSIGSHYFDCIDAYSGYGVVALNIMRDCHGHGVRLRGASLFLIGNMIVNPNISYPRLGSMFYGVYAESGALYALYNTIESYASPMDYGIYVLNAKPTIIRDNVIKGYGVSPIYGRRDRDFGIVTVTGDGIATEFTVDVVHNLYSDKVVCSATPTKLASIICYLVDNDGDGFRETLRLVIRFDSAPSSGEQVNVYWSAGVIE